jgi:hypothetical protein
MLCRRNDGLDRPKPLVARVVLDRPLLTVPFNCRWRGVQYDGIVASAARGYFKRGPGVSLMMIVMLVAGIGCLLAGLLAIGFGIPVQEFSFGNTLIFSGAVTACTGLILLGLWVVVGELKNIAQRLGPAIPFDPAVVPRPAAVGPDLRDQALRGGGSAFRRDPPAPDDDDHAVLDPQPPGTSPSVPWHQEARDRARGNDAPPVADPVEAAPAAPKQRRNLLFSSSSRRERERAQARTTDPSAIESRPAAPPVAEPNEVQPPTFDDAWPKSERSRGDAPLPRRGARAPSTFTETPAGAAAGADRQTPAARTEEPGPVTVLKSGVVDGMAYSLYSDGSIEAQMPEGMMRFASIDELRAHLDQRS